ncbi:MAG TPA: ATP-binding protein [Longimicrobium sp.]|nr:ATP-binding protein [Longimicrobium sp.]
MGLGRMNAVIGENGSGKTFLLKALYAAVRALEEAGRGHDPRSLETVLFDKLYWTFQVEKIGELVQKGADGPLHFTMEMSRGRFTYSFGKDTSRAISNLQSTVPQRTANSVFLPAKEVLSLLDVILKSREVDRVFGFDDTYLDLARALQINRQKGRNYEEFAQSRERLEAIIGGRAEYDERAKRWMFRKGRAWFGIEVTAEGIKKIAILDMLLGNRYLTPDSIIFIDEPEAALHPSAIVQFLDILATLSGRGIQIFIATHSYFVLKKLYLIAQQHEQSIPLAAHDGEGWHLADLRDGLPENAIVAESVRLYEQEVELALR